MSSGIRPPKQELDDAAIVTPEDIEAAATAWRRDAPEGAPELLDEKPEPVPEPEDNDGLLEM